VKEEEEEDWEVYFFKKREMFRVKLKNSSIFFFL
jgi:hypothetical protein